VGDKNKRGEREIGPKKNENRELNTESAYTVLQDPGQSEVLMETVYGEVRPTKETRAQSGGWLLLDAELGYLVTEKNQTLCWKKKNSKRGGPKEITDPPRRK